MSNFITVHAQDIRKGDAFRDDLGRPQWVAREDAQLSTDGIDVVVPIAWVPDGGQGNRWFRPGADVTVHRPG